MKTHMVNSGPSLKVYRTSNCPSDEVIGTIYYDECFIYISKHSGYNTDYIVFRNSSGQYSTGYLEQQMANKYGYALHNYGFLSSNIENERSYRFKLREPLNVVNNSGTVVVRLNAGDCVYLKSSTAGESNPQNVSIVGYRKNGDDIPYEGFVTLNYASGSMIKSNFFLYKG